MKFTALALAASLLFAAPAAAADFIPDSSRSVDEWSLNFSFLRDVVSPAAKYDPYDPRTFVSGSTYLSYGINPQTNTSQALIKSSHSSGTSTNQVVSVETESGDGWHRAEQALYFRALDFGNSTSPRAGLNLFGPSNYCQTGGGDADDPCDAAAYFSYVDHATGEVCLNKRYEWPSKLAAPKCQPIPGFEDGMPLNRLIGLKLVTYPKDDGDVRVVAYVNVPQDGQGWIRLIDYTDKPDAWNSLTGISATCQGKVTNGQTFSDSGKKCLAIQGFGDTNMALADSGALRNLFQAVVEGPTASPTSSPTSMPVPPTDQPSQSPTDIPSGSPSQQPSLESSQSPSQQLSTGVPSGSPSEPPSLESSLEPSQSPSSNPTGSPSVSPSSSPSGQLSVEPSQGPSVVPSQTLTDNPTDTTNPEEETSDPSVSPSPQPSPPPSLQPSAFSSQSPTAIATVSLVPTPVPPTSQSPTSSPTEMEGNDTEAPTSDSTSPPSDASQWVDYNIYPPALDYHFGSDGEYIRLDYVLSVPDYRVTVYGRSCTGPPVDDFFDITDVMTQRSDGDFDLALILNIIPETHDNPLLFNGDDEEKPVYQACVWVDALRAHDMEPQFHMTKSFGITLEVASNKFKVEADVVQGGGGGDSDHSFVLNNGLEAYFCDESGVVVNDALRIAGTGHYFCLQPTLEGAPIKDVVSLELEKDGTAPFVAIQGGNANQMVRKSQVPDSNVWIIQLMIPPRFFFSDGSLVVSGETSSSSNGRRLQAVGTDDSSGSFGTTAAIGRMMNGVVQIKYDVAVVLKNIAVPQDEEELLTTAMVIDAAIHRILSDEAFAKTLSIDSMEIPMLRSSRRLDEGHVEVVFLVTQFVECDDAKCINADERFGETIQATASTIGISANDGTLAAEIGKAAAAYNVDGFESLEVTSGSVNMSEASREIFEATSDESTRPTLSMNNILSIVAGAVLTCGALATFYLRGSKRSRRMRSDEEITSLDESTRNII